MRRLLAAALVLASCAACRPPEYADYASPWRDYTTSVPWGWQIITDQQGADFTQATFIGPFDGDFFLGAPSLSVRWYKNGASHLLRDDRRESYSGAEDFYKQMLRDVYGPRVGPGDFDKQGSLLPGVLGRKVFVSGLQLEDGSHSDGPSPLTLNSGHKATYFTVLSQIPAPPDNQWGITENPRTKERVVTRKHAYVLVPADGGFWVLCYPATAKGYERHEKDFRRLIGSFTPLTAGPGGAPVRRSARTN